MLTTPGIISPAAMSPRCSTPAICNSRISGIVMASHRADDCEHRQDDVLDESWRKQPEGGAGDDEHRKQPPAPSAAQSQAPCDRRAFTRNTDSLKYEVPGRQSIPATSGHGNHQFVNQS